MYGHLKSKQGFTTAKFALYQNVSHETLVAGKFNSPHCVAADSESNIIVAECLIGGKIN